MASILMWIGIALTVIGWLALSWQASRRLKMEDELEKFPQKKGKMRLYRSYCMFTISIGLILIIVAIIM
ncbi:MAG: hypothetical protein K2L89_02810 [Muribaculaceae bacterium]|nr:hypothetical protein [Muribaculaceae bacterium]